MQFQVRRFLPVLPFTAGDDPRSAMRIVKACAVLLLGAGVVHAGPADDCNQGRDPERQLRGCTDYIKLGKGAPENLATAYLNRANVYAQRARYDRALADYNAAEALDRQNPLIPYNRGNANFDRRQYARAVADFTRAIELDAGFALAFFNRGLAQEGLGDTAAAADDYHRALALDPGSTNARKRLERLQSQ
jgi:tetratricopeptide (TPR) repeat protein